MILYIWEKHNGKYIIHDWETPSPIPVCKLNKDGKLIYSNISIEFNSYREAVACLKKYFKAKRVKQVIFESPTTTAFKVTRLYDK